MKLIFNKSGNLILTTSGAIPSSHAGVDYIVAELAEAEEFNFNYNYILNSDGLAVKGALKQADHEEIARLQVEYEANAYKAQRAAAYPSMADQLDLLYHGGMDAWKAAITAVKEEFPK